MPAAGPAWAAIVERIHRTGPLPFSRYVEACLYGPGGFYTSGGGAGRRSDFLTSPEIGGLFGAVVARAIDAEWSRCGQPDPWVVIEAASGRGALAAAVLAASPACLPALRYVGVEISEPLRAAAAERLPVELPALVLGPGRSRRPVDDGDGTGDGDGDEHAHGRGTGSSVAGRGPLVTLLAELPAQPVTGMIIANELLDNLAFDLFERARSADGGVGGGGWFEVRVGESGDRLVEVLVPAAPADAEEATRLIPTPAPAPGARLPLQRGARRWLSGALGLIEHGRVVCIDYCSPTTAALAARHQHEWLRTYRRHGRGSSPLERPGAQDVTCEVAVDQLARLRPPTSDRSQASWLEANGVGQLVAEARGAWTVAAARPDLAALAARSRVGEGSALTDPAGLGGFRVLEWEVG